MKFCILSLTFLVLVSASGAVAQTNTCQVPDQMKKDQKLPCVRAGGFMVDQPALSMTQLSNGPDFNAAEPEKSRFAYFAAADNVLCYFRPHYAFMSVKGDSMKFQCWHMTADGAFYGPAGEIIPVQSVKVVIQTDKNGEKTASLFAGNDADNAHEIKADHFKVKYLKPPYPDHNTRYNEVFTEVAASRIMWVLGFPADHVYPLGSAACIGCTADPFDSNLKENTASLKAPPNIFKVASAERETPWQPIDPEGDETWSWSDAAKFYADGEWTHQQRVEYDAYRLALGLFHYHNAIAQQNRLACAQWAPETAGQPRVCQRPMIFVQDLGSTFGKAKGASDLFGTNPRGSFSDWESQTVFTNPQACELRATLDGDKHVLKEAQELMIQRLGRLDPQTVRTIFSVARFQMMDQKQLRRLRDGGSQNPEEAALDEWTNTFLKRIQEIKSATNCKSN